MANTQDMLDYVKQLKRHTEGRTAVIIRLSVLEKPFHESSYRQMMAACLTRLAQDYEGRYFVMPNRDGVVVVKEAHVDTIEMALNKVRASFAQSAVIKDLDPMQGVSDYFSSWYFLEKDYAKWQADMQKLVAAGSQPVDLGSAASGKPATSANTGGAKTTKASQSEDRPAMVRMPRSTRMVPVTPPKIDIPDKILNPESLLQLYTALKSTDLEGLLKSQWINAIVGTEAPQKVMLHRTVPFDAVVQMLVPNLEAQPDRILASFLMTLVDQRVVQSKPDMSSKNALLSSIKITLDTILSGAFASFDRSIDPASRKRVVIEIDMLDCIYNPAQMLRAMDQLSEMGYRTIIGGLEPHSFTWVDLSTLKVDFIKLRCRDQESDYTHDKELIKLVRDKVQSLAKARVILDGCDSPELIAFGQQCGINLFQGDAVSPLE